MKNKIVLSTVEIESRIRRRSKEKWHVEIKFSKQGEIVWMLKELKDEDKEGGWCSEARVDAWKDLVWLNQEGGVGWWIVGSKSDRLPPREDGATSLSQAAEVISLEKARAFSPGSSFSSGTETPAFADGTIECIIVWFIIGGCLRATISHPQPSSTPSGYTLRCTLETLKPAFPLALISNAQWKTMVLRVYIQLPFD